MTVALTDTSRTIVERVFSDEVDQQGADALTMAMIKNKANYYGDYDRARLILEELRLGVAEQEIINSTKQPSEGNPSR
jgi:hypothetical protein